MGPIGCGTLRRWTYQFGAPVSLSVPRSYLIAGVCGPPLASSPKQGGDATRKQSQLVGGGCLFPFYSCFHHGCSNAICPVKTEQSPSVSVYAMYINRACHPMEALGGGCSGADAVASPEVGHSEGGIFSKADGRERDAL